MFLNLLTKYKQCSKDFARILKQCKRWGASSVRIAYLMQILQILNPYLFPALNPDVVKCKRARAKGTCRKLVQHATRHRFSGAPRTNPGEDPINSEVN
jgi:hypothetical protein